MLLFHWFQLHNESCEYCAKKNYMLLKIEIILAKEIIVIHLISFPSQNDKSMKVTHDYNLCAIPTTKILIDAHVQSDKCHIFSKP